MRETAIERLWRDARVLAIGGGATEVMLEEVAKALMSTNADSILLAVDNRGVATLTLNRPEVHNAFDDGLIVALTHELREAAHDHDVRVIVLAANGKSFSAGADLNWMKTHGALLGGREPARCDRARRPDAHHRPCCPSRRSRACRGPAFGGGVGSGRLLRHRGAAAARRCSRCRRCGWA